MSPVAAWLALAASATVSVHAVAGEPLGISFSHKDWALVCDNTRTCRAEGYQAEDGDSEPVSLQITRPAGPNAPVSMALMHHSEKTVKAPLQFSVGKARLDGLAGEPIRLTDAMAASVLPELLRNGSARLASAHGQVKWALSLAGVNAVLLKMDEVQGRLETPGALVRRGTTRPEAAVPGPLPAPLVKRVVPVAGRASDDALGPRILAGIKPQDIQDQCNDTGSAPEPAVTRLTGKRVLLSLPCAQGAYNYTQLMFIANDKPPFDARLLEANGEFDPAKGSVHSSMKGRGVGDCWSSESWVFDGATFVLVESAGNAMCRGFPGGAWSAPTYVTRVEPPL
jgi:hypothetical protein